MQRSFSLETLPLISHVQAIALEPLCVLLSIQEKLGDANLPQGPPAKVVHKDHLEVVKFSLCIKQPFDGIVLNLLSNCQTNVIVLGDVCVLIDYWL